MRTGCFKHSHKNYMLIIILNAFRRLSIKLKTKKDHRLYFFLTKTKPAKRFKSIPHI